MDQRLHGWKLALALFIPAAIIGVAGFVAYGALSDDGPEVATGNEGVVATQTGVPTSSPETQPVDPTTVAGPAPTPTALTVPDPAPAPAAAAVPSNNHANCDRSANSSSWTGTHGDSRSKHCDRLLQRRPCNRRHRPNVRTARSRHGSSRGCCRFPVHMELRQRHSRYLAGQRRHQLRPGWHVHHQLDRNQCNNRRDLVGNMRHGHRRRGRGNTASCVFCLLGGYPSRVDCGQGRRCHASHHHMDPSRRSPPIAVRVRADRRSHHHRPSYNRRHTDQRVRQQRRRLLYLLAIRRDRRDRPAQLPCLSRQRARPFTDRYPVYLRHRYHRLPIRVVIHAGVATGLRFSPPKSARLLAAAPLAPTTVIS